MKLTSKYRKSRWTPRRRLTDGWGVEWLEARALLAALDVASAIPIDVGTVRADEVSTSSEVDLFQITLPENGRLSVRTAADDGVGFDTRTRLLGPEGELLIQSDGESVVNATDLIRQHLLAGTYFISVEGLGGAAGGYQLTTEFDAAIPPHEPVQANVWSDYPFAFQPTFFTTADFDGDGQLDVATANGFSLDITILMGLGDGTFREGRHIPIGFFPWGISSGDFDSDGKPDLVTQLGGDIILLPGLGDGSFGAALPFASGGPEPFGQTTADLNLDGHLDLIVNSPSSQALSVLLGHGDGSFQEPTLKSVGQTPLTAPVTGDFDGDGDLDVATTNQGSGDVSVLLNRGDGTLDDESRLAAGVFPSGLVAADLNRDGHVDLANTNLGESTVSVHWGRGDGTFDSQTKLTVRTSPSGIVAFDFNGDGHIDLATSNQDSNDVAVLLSRGDGTFHEPSQYRAGQLPASILARDVDGDGQTDLLTSNLISHDVSVLLGLGDGTFRNDLTDVRPGLSWPQGTVGADFNLDGHTDLVTVSSVPGDAYLFLGRGDGTFQDPSHFHVGTLPFQALAEDINGDGIVDLATVNCNSATASILLGNGDGTFQDTVTYATTRADFAQFADFNNDGHKDFVTGSPFGFGIGILLGRGDGTFQEVTLFAEHQNPVDGVAGDFNGDGNLDLATTNLFSPDHDISVHLGGGDGTFEAPIHYPVGQRPYGIVTADYNRDGHLDLVNTNFGSQSVSVLLGRGDGTFHEELRFATEDLPGFITTRDFNEDGFLDLLVSNEGSTNLSVLLGRGDGTFDDQVLYTVSDVPTPRRGLATHDFDHDGRLDLAIAQLRTDDIVVLPGLAEGRFGDPLSVAAGIGPVDVVTGEFNSDGRLDAAAVIPAQGALVISLGAGDATFEESFQLAAGSGPVSVSKGDFNRDGRLDLVTANHGSHDVSVFLGLGTGAFGEEQRLSVGASPAAVVTGDFDLDGRLDLATANATSDDISLLLGSDGGTFGPESRIAAGELPQAMATADFNRDGALDLVTANYRSRDLTLLLGNGDSTFQDAVRLELGTSPVDVKTGDLNADGQPDLVTANYRSHDVSVWLGLGDGSFQGDRRFEVGENPRSLSIGDFDGDGRADIATANEGSGNATFLLGLGDGTFSPPLRREVGDYPGTIHGDDFNDDGRLDLALTRQGFSDVSVLQGMGDLEYISGDVLSDSVRGTPHIADFNGDGSADAAVIGRGGKILLRQARPDARGVFDAPIEVNAGGNAARDLAVVSTGDQLLIAGLDARRPALSLYARNSDGTFARTAGPVIPGALPKHLAAGDLNGDGRSELVVAGGSNEVFVFLQNRSGTFEPVPSFRNHVGVSPSSVELVDVDGDRRLDIVVANQSSGDVSVLLNELPRPFSAEWRYRAGSAIYSLDNQGPGAAVRSSAEIEMSASGDFDGDGQVDLVVTDSGNNTYSILYGSGEGGFLNPASAATSHTGNHPTVVVVDRFNDDSHLDLAILNEVSEDLSILLGSPQGFIPVSREARETMDRPSAGNLPTGLESHDVDGDGNQDLLVGNAFGDLLTLFGNGDGSFQPYQRAGQNIAMELIDLDNDGQKDFIFTNEAMDRLSVLYSELGETFAQHREDGLLAPEAVSSADLNRDGKLDLVVANNGANNVLVYLGTGGGEFESARSFPTGTNPTDITIQDLNDDQLLDLVVANEGSNDVNVLLGEGAGASWTLANGPRLRAGAGPVSTRVDDATEDRIPDILVVNRQSNNVFVLPGVGGGFFDDRNPIIYDVGREPVALVPVDDGFATVNSGSNDLTFFADYQSSGVSVGSGGRRPVAGLSGDFNGDGIFDAVVANNGDGVVSLLLGTGRGLIHSGSFSSRDVPRPTALAWGDGSDVYVAGEGQESAVLLTSFGIPVLSPTTLAAPPDIFLVSGPGLGGELNIFATETATADEGEVQRPPVPFEYSDIVFASLETASVEQQAEADENETEQGEARRRNNLMMGVDDAIEQALSAGEARQADSGSVDALPRASAGEDKSIDSPRLADPRDVLRGMAQAVVAPTKLPMVMAAVDRVLTEWTADDDTSVWHGVRRAVEGLLDFFAQEWLREGRLHVEESDSVPDTKSIPPARASHAMETAAAHPDVRSSLFGDPAFVALGAAFVGRALARVIHERPTARVLTGN